MKRLNRLYAVLHRSVCAKDREKYLGRISATDRGSRPSGGGYFTVPSPHRRGLSLTEIRDPALYCKSRQQDPDDKTEWPGERHESPQRQHGVTEKGTDEPVLGHRPQVSVNSFDVAAKWIRLEAPDLSKEIMYASFFHDATRVIAPRINSLDGDRNLVV